MTLAALGADHRPSNPAAVPTPSAAVRPLNSDHRSIEMHIMNEQLARAYVAERHREAEQIRLARRVVSARRAQRKAEKAVLRARVAVLAVSQA